MAFSKQQRRRLIANILAQEVFGEEQRDRLEDLTDNQLVALDNPERLDELVANAAKPEAEEVEPTDNAKDDKPEAKPEPEADEPTDNAGKGPCVDDMTDNELQAYMAKRKAAAMKKKKPTANKAEMSVEEYLEGAPQIVKEVFNNYVKDQSERKAEAIEIIVNADMGFEKEELEGFTTNQLEKIAAPFRDHDEVPQASDYSGRSAGFAGLTSNKQEVSPLGLPDLWAE